ncbi:MAG: glucose-6-phosphate isomerase [Candidatus Nealsonbacteria bacterium]|nr:MAG: glucose-6-phosphate isomerase [Candidatus Nealsonbacteria bacterium]
MKCGRKKKKIKDVKPDVRRLYDMKKVIYDKEWLKTAPNFKLYYMYRGVKEKDGLKHNITIIPPRMLGKEFVKTKGHYHIGKYGELYIVLKGKAIYLLQKEKNGKIENVYYVKAKKGDYIIVPPDYGHITINPSLEELKMADWSSKKCKSDYKPIERKKGGCYYYTKSGWVKNKNYKKVPKLKFKKPKKTFPKNLSFLCGV